MWKTEALSCIDDRLVVFQVVVEEKGVLFHS